MLTRYYKLRIDTNERKDVIELISSYAETYLCAFENQGSDNPHCHLYIELLSDPFVKTPTSAIRKAIRQKYGSGNGSYSLKELDAPYPLEYLAYCIKEKDYITSDAFDLSKLKEAKAYDLKIKTEIRERKKARRTILQILEEENDFSDPTIDSNRVIDIVLEFYKNRNTLVRKFQVVSLCRTILLKYSESYKIEFSFQIAKELFP